VWNYAGGMKEWVACNEATITERQMACAI